MKEAEEEHKMEYVASWDRDMVRSATKRGLEHGMAKGMAAGLVKKAKEMAAVTGQAI
jgi:flagellar biosynthesis/type III secretory pathway protein FliH